MSQKIRSYDGARITTPRPTEFVDAAPMHGQRRGRWYPAGGDTPCPTVEATPYMLPVMVHRRRPIQQIGCHVEEAGAAGGVVRMGIYTDADGTPSQRVWDAGASHTTSVGPRVVSAPTDLILDPGQYWLALVIQGGAATRPVMRGTTLPNHLVGLRTITDGVAAGYVIPSVVDGALPAALSLTNCQVASIVPNIHIQL